MSQYGPTFTGQGQSHQRVSPAQHTTPDGPDRLRQNKLIGVEFTYIAPNGQQEEILMFVPPNGGYILPKDYYGGMYQGQMKVTLHTSDGDKQGVIQL